MQFKIKTHSIEDDEKDIDRKLSLVLSAMVASLNQPIKSITKAKQRFIDQTVL